MFAQRRDWFVQVVEEFASPEEMQKTIDNWNPVGCLVDRAMCRDAPPDNIFWNIPTVYLDQQRDKPSRRHPCLVHDNAAEAALISKELLSLKCASYAYVGSDNEYSWDIERLNHFKNDVLDAGFPFFKLSRKKLQAKIEALPKPCGIFGANDAYAAEAYHATAAAGFNIPNEVAIAGIDNDELFCETVSPGITSAQPDFQGAGYHLGEMLDEEIRKRDEERGMRDEARIEYYGPLRLVRRGSTFMQKGINPRIQRALEFIRQHACEGNLALDDIVAEMKCSKRLATMAFKKATGRTILEEVHNIRIQQVCDLLSHSNLPIATIVAHSGYNSDSFIKRMFLKRTGMTMRDYRKAHAQ